MSADALIDLLQIILLTVTTVVVMVTAGFKRDHGLINSLTQAGLCASLLIFLFVKPVLNLQITPLLVIDEYSLFFSALCIIGGIAVTALAYPYFEKHNQQNEEFYILVLLGVLGGVVLSCSDHFVSMFIGMEMIGISLYAMIAYPIHSAVVAKFPLEAAIKYLIMSGLASAVMLFGIALIYAMTGSFAFGDLVARNSEPGSALFMLIGFLMLIAGIAFKLSLFPFHMWTPDVYEGAPAPVTAFLATVSKAAMVAVALRLLLVARVFDYPQITAALSLLAAASMIFGNLLALQQSNLKRLLAYSSIAHLGYLLVVVIAAAAVPQLLSIESMSYYMTAYFLMSLGGFAVTSALSNAGRELDQVSDYQGLFWRNPWMSAALIVVLLSLAGIPLTAGFIGKFYVFTTGVEGQLWFLLAMLILGSAIGLYYYLRVIYVMLQPARDDLTQDPAANKLSFGVYAVMLTMAAAVLYLGVYPMPLIETLQNLASNF
ncbi:MAG: NADH-quinone oxidoreductase subunit N [Pseudomonadales bacterium]|jgi:NADH-quinone oxidoreductase subunit N|nr:NADH-quinone oxidoreductase subunit N [Pseudomonadales bacterium]